MIRCTSACPQAKYIWNPATAGTENAKEWVRLMCKPNQNLWFGYGRCIRMNRFYRVIDINNFHNFLLFHLFFRGSRFFRQRCKGIDWDGAGSAGMGTDFATGVKSRPEPVHEQLPLQTPLAHLPC